MFTIDLKEGTLSELTNELKRLRYTESDISQFLRETEPEELLKKFKGQPPFKALCIMPPGKCTLALGTKVEVSTEEKVTAVDFPIKGKHRSAVWKTKMQEETIDGADGTFQFIADFSLWKVPTSGVTVITGRNGAGKTHLLKYMHANLIGRNNEEVLFLDTPDREQQRSIGFFSSYEENKFYVVQRAKYRGLAFLDDLNPQLPIVPFENDVQYQYPHLKALCQNIFPRSIGSERVLGPVEEQLRRLSIAELENDRKVNHVIAKHVALSFSREANTECTFFSTLLTCFHYIGKAQEFVDEFNKKLKDNGLFYAVEIGDGFDQTDGLLDWGLRGKEGQEHGYDELSSGQQSMFNFISWAYKIPSDLSDKSDMHYKIMLLDEPDIHLDPDLVKQMFATFRRFTVDGIQVIMTTHKTDTVSLADEGSVFTIKDKAVVQCTKLRALLRMTKNTRELVNLRTTVFVEAHNDMLFFQSMHKHLSCLCQELQHSESSKFMFFQSSAGVGYLKFLSKRYLPQFSSVAQNKDGAGGGTSQIKQNMLRETALLNKKFEKSRDNSFKIYHSFAVMDYDYGNNDQKILEVGLKDRTLLLERHSLENFLFDPMILFSVLDQGDIDRFFAQRVGFECIAKDCIQWVNAHQLHIDELQNAIDDYFSYFLHTIIDNLPLLSEKSHQKTAAVIRICAFLGKQFEPLDLWQKMFNNGEFNDEFLQQFLQIKAIDRKKLGTPISRHKVDYMLVINNVYRAVFATEAKGDDIVRALLTRKQSMMYVHTESKREIKVQYPEFFIMFRGHCLEAIVIKKMFEGEDVGNFVVDKIREASGLFFPEDLAKVFFNLDRKIRAQVTPIVTPNKGTALILPPVDSTSGTALPPAPLIPQVTVAYCNRVTYDNPMLNRDGALVTAYRQGGMPLVDRMLDNSNADTNMLTNAVAFVEEGRSNIDSPTPSSLKLGRFERYWRTWQYRSEIKRLDGILKKYETGMTWEQALSSKLYRGKLINIHPDKKGSTEDAQFYKEFVEEFNNPYIQKANYFHYALHTAAVAVRFTDTTIDGVRVFYNHTLDNSVNLALSVSYAFSKIPSFHSAANVPVVIATIPVAYHLWNYNFAEAAGVIVKLGLFMSTPYAITALSAIPGAGQVVTGVVIAWNTYSMIQNIGSLCEEHEGADTVVDIICTGKFLDFSNKFIPEEIIDHSLEDSTNKLPYTLSGDTLSEDEM